MAEAIIAHPPSGGSSEHAHNRHTILAGLATASVVAVTPGVTLAVEADSFPELERQFWHYYSAVRVLEKVSGTPTEELGAGFYMPTRYDPHPALKAALAGEPIPPAPDGDE
jgi:hypothetical protein